MKQIKRPTKIHEFTEIFVSHRFPSQIFPGQAFPRDASVVLVDIFLISGLVDEDFRLFTMLRLLRALKFRAEAWLRILQPPSGSSAGVFESSESSWGHEHVWESLGDQREYGLGLLVHDSSICYVDFGGQPQLGGGLRCCDNDCDRLSDIFHLPSIECVTGVSPIGSKACAMFYIGRMGKLWGQPNWIETYEVENQSDAMQYMHLGYSNWILGKALDVQSSTKLWCLFSIKWVWHGWFTSILYPPAHWMPDCHTKEMIGL